MLIAATGRDGVDVLFEQTRRHAAGSPARATSTSGSRTASPSRASAAGCPRPPTTSITPRYLGRRATRTPRCSPSPASHWSGRASSCSASPGRTRSDPLDPAAAADRTSRRGRARGSYLVCRRLAPGRAGVLGLRGRSRQRGRDCTPVHARVAAGRPLAERRAAHARAPDADDPGAGRRRVRQQPLPVRRRHPAVGCCDPLAGLRRRLPPAGRAPTCSARVCPHFAHIRKVNPRDSATDLGTPADTLLRLMLRRGIPYGAADRRRRRPVAGAGRDAERGLMFARLHGLDRGPVRVRHPPLGELAGPARTSAGTTRSSASATAAGDRTRTVDVPAADGARRSVELDRDWVVPTGGGYFFAPPISAVAGVLGAEA